MFSLDIKPYGFILQRGGGGGVRMMVVAFSSRARILGECSTTHSPHAHFFFFFDKWRSARAHKVHSLGQEQSTVAQRDDRRRVVPGQLCVGSCPNRFPHYACTAA